jgi:DNA-directed RNA polymerase subunit RPC12/RpoP
MKSFTITLKVDCDYCGAMLPINGPLRSVVCDHCQKTKTLVPAAWCEQVSTAAEGMSVLGNPYTCDYTESTDPLCPGCDKHFPVDESVIGQDTFVACPHCGRKMATFSAPDWLKKELPGVVQIFGADREGPEGVPAGADAVEAEPDAARPAVLNCPNCQAALKISRDTERLIPCQHCGSDVFLPDALWFKLHPVRTVRAWTMVYTGSKLQTAEDIRKVRHEQLEVQQLLEERKREKAMQQKADEEDRARAARSRKLIFIIVLAGLAASGLIAALLALFGV